VQTLGEISNVLGYGEDDGAASDKAFDLLGKTMAAKTVALITKRFTDKHKTEFVLRYENNLSGS